MTLPVIRRVGIVALVVIAAWLTAGELGRGGHSAQAHTVSKRGNFFWALGSRERNRSKILDPINIQWIHGAIYADTSGPHVREVVEQNWGASTWGGPPPDRQRMLFGSACLFQSRIGRFVSRDSAIQDVIFKGQGGRGNRRQDTQYQGSTSSHCFTQWHMRFWNDHVHDDITPDHGPVDQWAISGVHHDIARCSYRVSRIGPTFGGCHEISGRWNAYRDYAVRRAMRHLCGRSRWKQHPGSDRKFQRHNFDGYIARIELTYDGPGCNRGLR